ncbi:MAG: hypothetical protein ACK4PI_12650 [Tepidisphaerales bacterium]
MLTHRRHSEAAEAGGAAMLVHAGSPPADRARLAQLGLALVAVCLFFGNTPVTGLVPAALSFFVPRFRVIGWWVTVVLVLLLASVSLGGLVYLLRQWSAASFEDPALAWWSLGLMSGTLLGCLLTLVGLLAPGTRRAMEARTTAAYPHAFDS